MSGVYVVVASNNCGEVEVCEVFAGQQSATSCVQEISGSMFNHYPAVEVMGDNSIRWTYVKTPERTVSIYWKAIKISHVSQEDVAHIVDQIVGVKDTLTVRFSKVIDEDGSVKASALVEDSKQSAINTEFLKSEQMPGGFDWFDKPVFSVTLFEDPENIKPTSELSDAQKWGLVTARVKKQPNFSLLIPFVGTFIQSSALEELKKKSVIGDQIVKMECDFLDSIRDEEINLQYIIRDQSTSY